MKVCVINGPNMGQLKQREAIYGNHSLAEIQKQTEEALGDLVRIQWWQTDHEAEMVQMIHSLRASDFDLLVINPAALSHSSLAIYDALSSCSLKVVEVHLTCPRGRSHKRENLLTAGAADVVLEGLGIKSYYYAIHCQLQRT